MNRRLLIVILGLAFLVGVLTCFRDFDHLWFYLGLVEPANLTGILGRPFHYEPIFDLESLVFAGGTTAFMARYVQPYLMDWRLMR